MERRKVSRTKKATSIRLTDDARALLEALAKDTGLSQAGVMELAVRELAKARGVFLPTEPQSQQ